MPSTGALARALDRLAAGFTGEAALAGTVFRAWLQNRGDKSRGLALAWAREQVRMGLAEILQREPTRRTGMAVDALSWLLLAGVEALVYEPPGAGADRVRILLEVAADTRSRA